MTPEQLTFLSSFGAVARDFKAQVYDRAAEVDPGNEYDWSALQIGFGLGRGLSPDDAHEFPRVLHYQFNDGAAVPDEVPPAGRPAVMSDSNETLAVRPLPAGAVIDFAGEIGVVVREFGESRLDVLVDGAVHPWYWRFEGET
jgi:hypothetical protein